MKERKWGRVINVLNIGAKAPGAESAPTSVSRAAQMALTKAMSMEGAPHNVLVKSLHVGVIISDQIKRRYDRERPNVSLDEYFARVPPHVLTVIDQAYYEYIADPEYPDAIEEYAKAEQRVLVLRTFSKIYGLAGLRVGYGIGPEDVITRSGRCVGPSTSPRGQRPPRQPGRGRGRAATPVNLDDELSVCARRAGLAAEPAVANFFVRVGEAEAAAGSLLRRRDRPAVHRSGAPDALRITAGTPDEIAFLADALAEPARCSARAERRRSSTSVFTVAALPVVHVAILLRRAPGRRRPPANHLKRDLARPAPTQEAFCRRAPSPVNVSGTRLGPVRVALIGQSPFGWGGSSSRRRCRGGAYLYPRVRRGGRRRFRGPPPRGNSTCCSQHRLVALVIGYDHRLADGKVPCA
jgi:hypothetical protein